MRILLTGASGFLAEAFLPHRDQHDFLAIRGSQKSLFQNDIQLDFLQLSESLQKIENLHFDAIIHLAAISQAAKCEGDPEKSKAINVRASVELATIAEKRQVPFVFASTDLVFDGGHANSSPEQAANPILEYGMQKIEAESQIQGVYPNSLIARLPLMYGWSSNPVKGQLRGLLEKLESGTESSLFTDEFRSPAHSMRVAEGLLKGVLNAWKGIYHFGGPERLSRYEFGISVAEIWQLDSKFITASSQSSIATGSPRPADCSMDSSKTFEAGWEHGTLKEELQQIYSAAGYST